MNNLKEARDKARLTQAQIAESAKITVLSYYRYEQKKRLPDVLTAIRIAKALGKQTGDMEELFPLKG